jgi:hypothetical protein
MQNQNETFNWRFFVAITFVVVAIFAALATAPPPVENATATPPAENATDNAKS